MNVRIRRSYSASLMPRCAATPMAVRLAVRGGSPASHRGRRCARSTTPARQPRWGPRMQADFHHGLPTVGGRFNARVAPIAGAFLALYAGGRAYRDYPALDRSHDDRPAAVVGALTAGLDDRHAILLADL